LRRCGVNDPIPGFGRLLREFWRCCCSSALRGFFRSAAMAGLAPASTFGRRR